MAHDSSDHDHRVEPEPQNNVHAKWLPGPLERPIVGDDEVWSDDDRGTHDEEPCSAAEENEQDDRRYIIRLGGNGF
jgi:hypothetical protein